MSSLAFKTLQDIGDITGKRVLVRVDLNVPMKDGKVTDFTRIRRVVPTIEALSDKAAKVILLSHLGRPNGKRVEDLSLEPVARALEASLDNRVYFAPDCIGNVPSEKISRMGNGNILLLENLRFHPGEEANDPEFAAKLAKLGDLYVNEAFSAAHRAHASTEGIAHLLPSFAGYEMEAELKALTAGLEKPKRPLLAIVGGAKVSTKIGLLENLVEKVDMLVIGGGMANTFLNANGIDVGKSLCEKDLAETARKITAAAKKCEIILPVDAVVARKFEAHAASETVPIESIPADAMVLDVGPRTVENIVTAVNRADTLVWNGPLGAFEIPPFDKATLAVARHVAERTRTDRLVSIVGGGDTVAALNQSGVAGDMTYTSTAGGAFLEWMEGKTLPGVAALTKQ